MNKKVIVGSSTIIILIIIGVVVSMLFIKTINPHNIFVTQANVSDNTIEVVGEFTDGFNHFKGYKTEYVDETHFIKIKGGIGFLMKQGSGGINILMNNTFGNIKEVYLQDHSGNKVQIWAKE